ncbi:MAG: NUDIX hydrolase [Dehalococcoidia bacterium]
MPFTPVLGTLGYILSADRTAVLMVVRDARPDDTAFGKYNGLGGKLEPGEDVATGMVREIREEAAIEVTAMELRGTLSWPGFGRENESWFGFVFLITAFEGTPATANHEGRLVWVPLETVLAGGVPMWEGDKLWLHMVFDGDPRPFHGVEPYDGLTPLLEEWRFTRM